MKQKPHAVAGMAAPVLFVGTYLLLAAARPEFNHLTKAVGELGAVNAPNAATWNLFGYIIPGLLIAFFSVGLHRAVAHEEGNHIPFYSLFLSGVFMVVAGMFPGNFKDPGSLTSILHSAGSFGTFLCFLVAGFTYPLLFRKSNFWEKTIIPSLTLTWLCILSGFLRTGAAPGLGHRAGFLLYFLWIAFIAFNLFRYDRFS